MQMLFPLFFNFFVKVDSLGERCPSESHRQIISFFLQTNLYTGSKGQSLSFLPKLLFPVPECRGGCYCVKIEGYSGAFQLWKWLVSAEVPLKAERGGGGLAIGKCALKRQKEQLRCRWKFWGAEGLAAPRWFLL